MSCSTGPGLSVATIAAPRRQRFTLRLISEAERDGLVAVDPATERVTLVER